VGTKTYYIWLQDVDRTAPLDMQEGRIKRWLKEDTSVQLGEAIGDAMLFFFIEWPGDRFQWSVRVPAQLKEIYLRRGVILLPPYSTQPAVRLDVYEITYSGCTLIAKHYVE
jgi:hypothetical protein